MIEGGAHDIATHHILSPPTLPRHGVSLDFNQAPLDRPNMGLNQPAVAAYQRLDANRLRRAEDAVPTRAVFAVVSRGGDKYRPAVRVNALQQALKSSRLTSPASPRLA